MESWNTPETWYGTVLLEDLQIQRMTIENITTIPSIELEEELISENHNYQQDIPSSLYRKKQDSIDSILIIRHLMRIRLRIDILYFSSWKSEDVSETRSDIWSWIWRKDIIRSVLQKDMSRKPHSGYVMDITNIWWCRSDSQIHQPPSKRWLTRYSRNIWISLSRYT